MNDLADFKNKKCLMVKNRRSKMIQKFKAFLKDTKKIADVKSIFFELGIVMLSNDKFYQFDDIILMQSTGIYDKHDVEIFDGYIIQQVHAYDFDKLEIETDYLEPFEVKKRELCTR